jgi:Ca2+-transporting ATPase
MLINTTQINQKLPPEPSGLTDAEAAERLRQEGPNELPDARPKSNLAIAAGVLREPMFLLLMVTGAVYFLLGDREEALALLAAIFVIIGITVYQQGKTERTLEALRDLSSPRALVIRDGQRKRIPGREVVRGDVLAVSEGDRVAADAFLLSVVNLSVDESMLTGESVPVKKEVWDGKSQMGRPGREEPPAIFSGTLIVQGSGFALVERTGPRTEMGRLGKSLGTIGVESTNLQRETRSLVRLFGAASLVLCALVAVVYGLMTLDWLNGALAGLALAISLVPEEFPVVLTVFLALGAWRISKKRVLTRRVAAIEMLGAATVLCVDKTGTLTMNRMAVREVFPAGARTDSEIAYAAARASAEDPVDPMERALHEAAAKHADADVDPPPKLIRQYPLSRDLLAMSHVVNRGDDSTYLVYAKGAPEAIAQLCRLAGVQSNEVARSAQSMAGRGLRVLGVAEGRVSKSTLPESHRDIPFEFLGLIGLEDPVRPSVPHAIKECYTAGIRVVMVTGDYPATAHSIAGQIGLTHPGESVTGAELDAMPEEELRARVRNINVFSRILPEQKLRIVEAFKANGEVVAMTGDGVNDAPALKAAHIGIAMGGRGTDVAREAASLVLLDDDFSSIVEAIRLGRRIYDNLRKAMTYVFAIHLPIAGISLLPLLVRFPMVLMPLHIVFLELIIDPACSIAFESEAEDPRIMNRRPRDPKARMFDKKTLWFVIEQGLGLLLMCLAALLIARYQGLGTTEARTITFTTLILGNLALVWANRSRTRVIPEMILRAQNWPLWIITASALTVLTLVLAVPYARSLFQFSTLRFRDVALCIALSLASVSAFELVKLRGRGQ